MLILGLLASTSTAIRDIALQEGALEALLNQPGIMLYSPKSNKYILQSLEYLLLGESPPNLDEYEIGLEVLLKESRNIITTSTNQCILLVRHYPTFATHRVNIDRR